MKRTRTRRRARTLDDTELQAAGGGFVDDFIQQSPEFDPPINMQLPKSQLDWGSIPAPNGPHLT